MWTHAVQRLKFQRIIAQTNSGSPEVELRFCQWLILQYIVQKVNWVAWPELFSMSLLYMCRYWGARPKVSLRWKEIHAHKMTKNSASVIDAKSVYNKVDKQKTFAKEDWIPWNTVYHEWRNLSSLQYSSSSETLHQCTCKEGRISPPLEGRPPLFHTQRSPLKV